MMEANILMVECKSLHDFENEGYSQMTRDHETEMWRCQKKKKDQEPIAINYGKVLQSPRDQEEQ